MTRPRKKFRGEAIFSRRGNRVMAVLHTTLAVGDGELAHDAVRRSRVDGARSGSATGVAVVMRYEPAKVS